MSGRSHVSRRRFLQSTGAGLAAGCLGAGHSAATDEKALADESPGGKTLIIDCHAHIYSENEQKYPTIDKPYRPPEGKGTVAHLKHEMRSAGVRYVTAIQTSSFYRWDNRFTTDSSRDNADFMAGVCTLNPDDPGSPALLEHYVKDYNVRGMRTIAAKNGKLDDPGVDALWTTAERLGIVFNVLVGSGLRNDIESLVKRHPKLRVVIDHCLNLKAGPTLEPTLRDMLALAKHPTIHAKLTFIPTGSAEEYPCRDMHAACKAIINEFSPQRCVWGSDFPCELWCPKLSYAQHLKIFTDELGLEQEAKRAILGETAYGLWFAPLKA